MSSKKTIVTALAVGVAILVGAGSYALLQNDTDKTASLTSESQAEMTASQPQTTQSEAEASTTEQNKSGRYTQYTGDKLAENGYQTNVVFFYAPWCPECRSFKQAINQTTIPAGTQILEADFDSSTDLKKQYGVTLQSTFVRVDNNGELQKKWVGYGKEKSLQIVLDNVR